ncbi:matrix metalloproteinase-17b isoform X1 [Paramormyrops kingsleyae]|uniref:Matrix metallopeptidase 17b n=1 Tax=Paramormyrops kingsleyae TaxID=1676925 RepID=A0A3B3Q504_9TELE|nr:matrix metalloproteinase-17-like isoform X1 [Paramormyrops kingsleyae]XP_023653157.1 matrix metalloproteinase-17-like isoform X1 [Paramormyrops kingsleyae]XP_023653158.1 matrix metalloproteinase-17-like isoform X1 [Paramormyrops kingsleyae]
MRVMVWGLRLLYVCKLVEAFPISPLHPTIQTSSSSAFVSPTEDESTELVDWLTRYGYLPPSDPSTGQLQAWTAVTQALRTMQNFAGLNVTGAVDKDTLDLMRQPRCSLPDEDKEQDPLHAGRHRERRGVTWTYRNINWRLRSYPTPSALSRETIRSLVFYALKVWAEPIPLEFHEVGSPVGADLLVDFLHGSHGDGFPFDGPGGSVGHAFFPSDPDRAGAVHLDSQEDWAFRQPPSEGIDLFTVLVHEFGHALGLSHSSSKRSVMRPYYHGSLGDALDFTLSSLDREQITKLYGNRDNHLAIDSTDTALQPHFRRREQYITEQQRNTFDRCATSFDAVAKIRGETFFFKGLSMWRVSRGGLVSGKPAVLRQMWRGLPPSLASLQAVLERQSDHAIVFISGPQYWLFKDLSLQEGYPRPLSDLGAGGQEVEQGLVWDMEKGTVWGNREAENNREENGEIWKELLRKGVNGITTDEDGSINIFRGQLYWKFPYPGSSPGAGFPRSLATDWLDCPQPFSSAPGSFSFSQPTGNEFHGVERDREVDQEDRRHSGKKTRGKNVLEQWACPCLNSGVPGVDLMWCKMSLVLPLLLPYF